MNIKDKFKEVPISSGVYEISHPSTHRIYIGSAENLKDRFENHLYALTGNYHHTKRLQKLWNSEDKELLKFSILEICRKEDLEIREQYYLDTILKANENNGNFYRLGLNSGRSSKRNSSKCEKAILQYDLDGSFIREWKSAKQASIDLKLPYTSIIQCVSLKSYHQRTGNFIFRKFEENYPLNIKGYNYVHHLQKKIKVTNLVDGSFKIFEGKRETCRKLNICRTMINRCIKMNKIHIEKQLKFEEI